MTRPQLLSKTLDSFGLFTDEIVNIRRKTVLLSDHICSGKYEGVITAGSTGEGLRIGDCDFDHMNIFPDVIVLYPDLHPNIPEEILPKIVLFIRETDCQPGYVFLEVGRQDNSAPINILINHARIQFQNSVFISSELVRVKFIQSLEKSTGLPMISNGPCSTYQNSNTGVSQDFAFSFFCPNWPREATAWINRPRLYGWPSSNLVNKIVYEGCHLVPVGDKCSSYTSFQWRISFVSAERHLVHSLTHLQLQVYMLLKYTLHQIKGLLKCFIKEDDILCSYFLKTIIFYAVENSPPSLWQEKFIFVCFLYCINILIDWVRSAFCPNYFIPENNLFRRKVRGENKKKLLQFLLELRHMKWGCLSLGTFYQPTIGDVVQSLIKGEPQYLHLVRQNKSESEYETDVEIFVGITTVFDTLYKCSFNFSRIIAAQQRSQSDTDDFVTYSTFVAALSNLALDAHVQSTECKSNKQKYKYHRKCKYLLVPLASLLTSPGKLNLATLFYLKGQYTRTLNLCSEMTSYEIFPDYSPNHLQKHYQDRFCGKGYNLYQKCKNFVILMTITEQLCPLELLPEVKSQPPALPLKVPPLPFAIFLTVLSHHHLQNTRGRDRALRYLKDVCCSDIHQGGDKFWIVHSLLGICYQVVGRYYNAIKSFQDSLRVDPEYNPADKKIADCCRELFSAMNI